MDKKSKDYNWWDDPANAEEVKRISWWEHEENKTTIPLPVSITNGDGYWVVANNSETTKLLGENLHATSQGKTKEEAIRKFFLIMKLSHDYEVECANNYQRWVPFRKGNWSMNGGRWFVVYGMRFYFRYGKNMKGGWYIPFTKLNISFHSEWATYRRWKQTTLKRR